MGHSDLDEQITMPLAFNELAMLHYKNWVREYNIFLHFVYIYFFLYVAYLMMLSVTQSNSVE
jgi:hypothetical protein